VKEHQGLDPFHGSRRSKQGRPSGEDELLFGAKAAAPSTQSNDSDWGPLKGSELDGGALAEFDVVGGAAPKRARSADRQPVTLATLFDQGPTPPATEPSPAAAPGKAPVMRGPTLPPAELRPAELRAPARSPGTAPKAPRPAVAKIGPPPQRLPRGPRSPLGYALPVCLFAGGAGAACWLFSVQQNQVMAGVAAAAGAVGAAFAWVMLRP
jgi:hypothetical protein